MRKSLLIAAVCACLSANAQQVHRLALADCDDPAFGPGDDIFLACHSPEDKFPAAVRRAKPVDTMDAYILRVRARTGEILYATRLPGNDHDAALQLRVDSRGHAWVAGMTRSPDFGGTPLGGLDAFLVELSPGGEVLHSERFGSPADDIGHGIALDARDNVYIGGNMGSDGFVCRRDAGTGKLSCRTFGGSKNEVLFGIALDGKGGLWAVGTTESADFPSQSSRRSVLRGKSDAFATRFSAADLSITFSTLIGGSGEETAWSITVDRHGNPVIAGVTDSTDLPGTAGMLQPRNAGKKDAFIAILDAKRNLRATYFGGSADDEAGYDGGSVKVDGAGRIWLAGMTYSTDLPTRNATQATYGGGNGDGFVVAFDANLRRTCFATYFGDARRNLLEGIAISPSGLVAATGLTFATGPEPAHVRLGETDLYPGFHLWTLDGGSSPLASKCQ